MPKSVITPTKNVGNIIGEPIPCKEKGEEQQKLGPISSKNNELMTGFWLEQKFLVSKMQTGRER